MLDHIDEIKALVAKGVTQPEIGAKFGVGRNTINGFCQRHKIRRHRFSSFGKLVKTPVAQFARKEIAAPDPSSLCSIIDAGFGQCRFVCDDSTFPALVCGAATEKGCWCPYHYKIVHRQRDATGRLLPDVAGGTPHHRPEQQGGWARFHLASQLPALSKAAS